MTAVTKHLGTLLLAVSCGLAQTATAPVTVRKVAYTRQGSDLQVEVTLSAPVQPSIETAVNPDRILLDFPGTVSGENAPKVEINTYGVKRVRTAQHSAAPPVTRVVLDLDAAHPYTMKAEGNRILITVGPSQLASKSSHGGAPPPAMSGGISGIFRHKETPPPPMTADQVPVVPTPAPLPPLNTGTTPAPAKTSAPVIVATGTVAVPSQKSSANASATLPTFSTTEVAGGAQQHGGDVTASGFPSASSGNSTGANSGVVATGGFDAKAEDEAAANKAAQLKAAELKAAEDKAAADRVVADKAAADKAAELKAAEEKTAADKALAEKAAADKAAEATVAEAKVPDAASASPAAAEAPVPDAANPDAVPVAATPVPAEAMLMARTEDPSLRTVFRVKYVADGVAYLEGGRAQGLTEGMKLQVEETNLPTRQGATAHAADDPRVVAELEVSGVAETSAVTEIHEPKRQVKAGDLAYLSVVDTASLVQERTLSSTRQYPAVISFSEGDPLDEDAREEVPRPPSPAVNRSRGRFGLDYNRTINHGLTDSTSSNLGFAIQADITRIGGTFWNLSGYYRGRFTSQSATAQPTLQDLINHTYHLSLSYENPTSKLVAAVGRLYLPWASSLDTIDGGYFGFHPKQGETFGVFGGSTPDPTSWTYAPNRAISGGFVNFEGGSYEKFHYSSTSGAGISMINWAVDRPFIFFEDTLSWGRRIGIYEAAQVDSPSGNGKAVAPGFGLGRSFFTLRVQPATRVELNFNYNYFRDIPTADPALLSTTLLDKFLFQGFSAGARVEVLKQVFVSGTLGRSDRTGDKSSSLNEQLGLTLNQLPWWKLRADVRYSRFNSSFGTGSYESLSVSRQLSDSMRLEFLAGQQSFVSQVTNNPRTRFYTSTMETTLGPHYYIQGNFTVNRGELSYDQYLFSFGYRFDNRLRGRQ